MNPNYLAAIIIFAMIFIIAIEILFIVLYHYYLKECETQQGKLCPLIACQPAGSYGNSLEDNPCCNYGYKKVGNLTYCNFSPDIGYTEAELSQLIGTACTNNT